MNKPVGTNARSSGLMVSGSLIAALMSIPDESAVAYSGNALSDRFMILILTNDMRTKIRDTAQGARFVDNRQWAINNRY